MTTTFTFAPSSKKVTDPKGQKIELGIAKSDAIEVTLDGKKLPAASVEYLLTYGAKQSLADSYSSATDQKDFDAMLGKRFDAIIDGKMTFREGGSPIDPFEAECLKLAKVRLVAAANKQGKKLPKVSTEKYKALLAAVRNGKAKDKIESEAKRNIAAAAKLADEIEIDDLDFSGLES
jgi:hypothetical protein